MADVVDLDILVQFVPMSPVEYAKNYLLLTERLEELCIAPVGPHPEIPESTHKDHLKDLI